MKTYLFSCGYIYLFLTYFCVGQNVKGPLLEGDYKQWSTMDLEQISDYGNWISYALQYESGNDTLFVKNTKTLKKFSFPKGYNGQFAKENYFVCQNNKEQLVQTKLSNGKQQVINQVIAYTISKEAKYLLTLKKTGDEKKELIIKNLEKNNDVIIPDVSIYSYNSEANALVYHSNNQLTLVYLDTSLQKIIIENNTLSTYSDIVWQKKGEAIAYFIHDDITKIGFYQLKERKRHTFNPETFSEFPNNSALYNASSFELTIADDGSKVFFGVKPNDEKKDTSGVQIWNTEDKSLYPEKKEIKGYTAVPKVGLWIPKSNNFRMISSVAFPYITLTGDQKKALLFNPLNNEPQFDRNAPIDFYLSDVTTGKQKLILQRQSPDESKLSVSGDGKYITYFKDKNWWIYDIVKEEHRNLTKSIGVSFERQNYDWSGEVESCGMAGWASNDEELLLYDNYDVWLVKTDGSKFKRVTNGREKNIVYRIVPTTKDNVAKPSFNWMKKGNFKLHEGIILQAKADSKSGYFKWDLQKGISQIVFNQNRIKNIKVASTSNVYSYTSEHYHQAPQILVKNNNKTSKIVQSNPQQKNFQWGFSKLITFSNSKEEILKAALFYPANYNPEKKYPMVVQVYEKLSDNYNKYTNPTLLNSTGFNITNYTSQGYFVLLPDIVKEKGKPGPSAVDCVISAIKEVTSKESVDPKRIGLIGHSFGGYEANFIVTQTNKFAAVVSSAGESDMISNYLSINWNNGKSNGFRAEFQQSNIGSSPFENQEAYLLNSPITFVKKVETPILLWSGDEDKQVHYFQSLEFHLALRRLQKPNILLLYENEKHTIIKKENQVDLSHRIQQWFDYYLKGASKPNWFTSDKL